MNIDVSVILPRRDILIKKIYFVHMIVNIFIINLCYFTN